MNTPDSRIQEVIKQAHWLIDAVSGARSRGFTVDEICDAIRASEADPYSGDVWCVLHNGIKYACRGGDIVPRALRSNLTSMETKSEWIAELHAPENRVGKPKDERPMFVYLMHNKRNGLFKIGYSRSTTTREKTLQGEEPEIVLVAHTPGRKRDEQSLHERFAAERVRGEWFRLTDEQVSSIVEGMRTA